jgi:formylglycine-generating enzyme required for sulfatase activity
MLIGRRQPVRIFQDVTAIPLGTDWLKGINKALDESSFLIPIVTPAFLESEMCCHEVMRFHQREQELGRDDLIFPFHYIDVSDIEPGEVHDPVVLALLKSRQRFDFALFRYRPPESEEVATKLGTLAMSIRVALRRPVAPVSLSGKPEPIASYPLPSRPEPVASFPLPGKPEPMASFPRPARPEPVAPLAPPVGRTVTRERPGPEMVLIPAGRFFMGVPEGPSESTNDYRSRPQHSVAIARPFWLGKYSVTQGEYADFLAETGYGGGSWAATKIPQDEWHPAVSVSYEDALAYFSWLNDKTGLTYRLPSEAERECAARAGTTTARYWGEDVGKPGEHAHFGVPWGSSKGHCQVGSCKPNTFGLHDMLGNVREWTADRWHDNYTGAPYDGSTWSIGGAAARVIRGGSWFDDTQYVRAAARSWFAPGYRTGYIGFRCARAQT